LDRRFRLLGGRLDGSWRLIALARVLSGASALRLAFAHVSPRIFALGLQLPFPHSRRGRALYLRANVLAY